MDVGRRCQGLGFEDGPPTEDVKLGLEVQWVPVLNSGYGGTLPVRRILKPSGCREMSNFP